MKNYKDYYKSYNRLFLSENIKKFYLKLRWSALATIMKRFLIERYKLLIYGDLLRLLLKEYLAFFERYFILRNKLDYIYNLRIFESFYWLLIYLSILSFHFCWVFPTFFIGLADTFDFGSWKFFIILFSNFFVFILLFILIFRIYSYFSKRFMISLSSNYLFNTIYSYKIFQRVFFYKLFHKFGIVPLTLQKRKIIRVNKFDLFTRFLFIENNFFSTDVVNLFGRDGLDMEDDRGDPYPYDGSFLTDPEEDDNFGSIFGILPVKLRVADLFYTIENYDSFYFDLAPFQTYSYFLSTEYKWNLSDALVEFSVLGFLNKWNISNELFKRESTYHAFSRKGLTINPLFFVFCFFLFYSETLKYGVNIFYSIYNSTISDIYSPGFVNTLTPFVNIDFAGFTALTRFDYIPYGYVDLHLFNSFEKLQLWVDSFTFFYGNTYSYDYFFDIVRLSTDIFYEVSEFGDSFLLMELWSYLFIEKLTGPTILENPFSSILPPHKKPRLYWPLVSEYVLQTIDGFYSFFGWVLDGILRLRKFSFKFIPYLEYDWTERDLALDRFKHTYFKNFFYEEVYKLKYADFLKSQENFLLYKKHYNEIKKSWLIFPQEINYKKELFYNNSFFIDDYFSKVTYYVWNGIEYSKSTTFKVFPNNNEFKFLHIEHLPIDFCKHLPIDFFFFQSYLFLKEGSVFLFTLLLDKGKSGLYLPDSSYIFHTNAMHVKETFECDLDVYYMLNLLKYEISFNSKCSISNFNKPTYHRFLKLLKSPLNDIFHSYGNNLKYFREFKDDFFAYKTMHYMVNQKTMKIYSPMFGYLNKEDNTRILDPTVDLTEFLFFQTHLIGKPMEEIPVDIFSEIKDLDIVYLIGINSASTKVVLHMAYEYDLQCLEEDRLSFNHGDYAYPTWDKAFFDLLSHKAIEVDDVPIPHKEKEWLILTFLDGVEFHHFTNSELLHGDGHIMKGGKGFRRFPSVVHNRAWYEANINRYDHGQNAPLAIYFNPKVRLKSIPELDLGGGTITYIAKAPKSGPDPSPLQQALENQQIYKENPQRLTEKYIEAENFNGVEAFMKKDFNGVDGFMNEMFDQPSIIEQRMPEEFEAARRRFLENQQMIKAEEADIVYNRIKAAKKKAMSGGANDLFGKLMFARVYQIIERDYNNNVTTRTEEVARTINNDLRARYNDLIRKENIKKEELLAAEARFFESMQMASEDAQGQMALRADKISNDIQGEERALREMFLKKLSSEPSPPIRKVEIMIPRDFSSPEEFFASRTKDEAMRLGLEYFKERTQERYEEAQASLSRMHEQYLRDLVREQGISIMRDYYNNCNNRYPGLYPEVEEYYQLPHSLSAEDYDNVFMGESWWILKSLLPRLKPQISNIDREFALRLAENEKMLRAEEDDRYNYGATKVMWEYSDKSVDIREEWQDNLDKLRAEIEFKYKQRRGLLKSQYLKDGMSLKLHDANLKYFVDREDAKEALIWRLYERYLQVEMGAEETFRHNLTPILARYSGLKAARLMDLYQYIGKEKVDKGSALFARNIDLFRKALKGVDTTELNRYGRRDIYNLKKFAHSIGLEVFERLYPQYLLNRDIAWQKMNQVVDYQMREMVVKMRSGGYSDKEILSAINRNRQENLNKLALTYKKLDKKFMAEFKAGCWNRKNEHPLYIPDPEKIDQRFRGYFEDSVDEFKYMDMPKGIVSLDIKYMLPLRNGKWDSPSPYLQYRDPVLGSPSGQFNGFRYLDPNYHFDRRKNHFRANNLYLDVGEFFWKNPYPNVPPFGGDPKDPRAWVLPLQEDAPTYNSHYVFLKLRRSKHFDCDWDTPSQYLISQELPELEYIRNSQMDQYFHMYSKLVVNPELDDIPIKSLKVLPSTGTFTPSVLLLKKFQEMVAFKEEMEDYRIIYRGGVNLNDPEYLEDTWEILVDEFLLNEYHYNLNYYKFGKFFLSDSGKDEFISQFKNDDYIAEDKIMDPSQSPSYLNIVKDGLKLKSSYSRLMNENDPLLNKNDPLLNEVKNISDISDVEGYNNNKAFRVSPTIRVYPSNTALWQYENLKTVNFIQSPDLFYIYNQKGVPSVYIEKKDFRFFYNRYYMFDELSVMSSTVKHLVLKEFFYINKYFFFFEKFENFFVINSKYFVKYGFLKLGLLETLFSYLNIYVDKVMNFPKPKEPELVKFPYDTYDIYNVLGFNITKFISGDVRKPWKPHYVGFRDDLSELLASRRELRRFYLHKFFGKISNDPIYATVFYNNPYRIPYPEFRAYNYYVFDPLLNYRLKSGALFDRYEVGAKKSSSYLLWRFSDLLLEEGYNSMGKSKKNGFIPMFFNLTQYNLLRFPHSILSFELLNEATVTSGEDPVLMTDIYERAGLSKYNNQGVLLEHSRMYNATEYDSDDLLGEYIEVFRGGDVNNPDYYVEETDEFSEEIKSECNTWVEKIINEMWLIFILPSYYKEDKFNMRLGLGIEGSEFYPSGDLWGGGFDKLYGSIYKYLFFKFGIDLTQNVINTLEFKPYLDGPEAEPTEEAFEDSYDVGLTVWPFYQGNPVDGINLPAPIFQTEETEDVFGDLNNHLGEPGYLLSSKNNSMDNINDLFYTYPRVDALDGESVVNYVNQIPKFDFFKRKLVDRMYMKKSNFSDLVNVYYPASSRVLYAGDAFDAYTGHGNPKKYFTSRRMRGLKSVMGRFSDFTDIEKLPLVTIWGGLKVENLGKDSFYILNNELDFVNYRADYKRHYSFFNYIMYSLGQIVSAVNGNRFFTGIESIDYFNRPEALDYKRTHWYPTREYKYRADAGASWVTPIELTQYRGEGYLKEFVEPFGEQFDSTMKKELLTSEDRMRKLHNQWVGNESNPRGNKKSRLYGKKYRQAPLYNNSVTLMVLFNIWVTVFFLCFLYYVVFFYLYRRFILFIYKEYGVIFKSYWFTDWLWFYINLLEFNGIGKKQHLQVISLNRELFNEMSYLFVDENFKRQPNFKIYLFKVENFEDVFKEKGDPCKGFGVSKYNILQYKRICYNYSFKRLILNSLLSYSITFKIIKFLAIIFDFKIKEDERYILKEFYSSKLFFGLFSYWIINKDQNDIEGDILSNRVLTELYPVNKDNYYFDQMVYEGRLGLLKKQYFFINEKKFFLKVKNKGLIKNKKRFLNDYKKFCRGYL